VTVAAVAPPQAAADRSPYVGLVTRCLAFGIDAAIINLTALFVVAVTALCLSIISLPGWLKAIVVGAGAVVYVLWFTAYFVTFWTTTGQTPGDRLLHIRVKARNGERIKPRRALLRFVALWLAALPLFLGYLMILVDDRRRGLHDVLARTVVVEAPPEAPKR
jgi:uncharacterized RDD family membrane protein YckC